MAVVCRPGRWRPGARLSMTASPFELTLNSLWLSSSTLTLAWPIPFSSSCGSAPSPFQRTARGGRDHAGCWRVLALAGSPSSAIAGLVNTTLQSLGLDLDAAEARSTGPASPSASPRASWASHMTLALLASVGRLDRTLEEARLLAPRVPHVQARHALPLSLPAIALAVAGLCFVMSAYITPKLLAAVASSCWRRKSSNRRTSIPTGRSRWCWRIYTLVLLLALLWF